MSFPSATLTDVGGLVLGLVLKPSSSAYQQAIITGATTAMQGTAMRLLHKPPPDEWDPEIQAGDVWEFFCRHAHGLGTLPMQTQRLDYPVDNTNQGGIPSLTLDTSLPGDHIPAHIGPDHYADGATAAHCLAGRKAAVIEPFWPDPGAVERIAGFHDVAEARCVLSHTEKPEVLWESGCDAFYIPCEETAATLLDAGLTANNHDIQIICWGCDKRIANAFEQRGLRMWQRPDAEEIGRRFVESVTMKLRGETPEKEQIVATQIRERQEP